MRVFRKTVWYKMGGLDLSIINVNIMVLNTKPIINFWKGENQSAIPVGMEGCQLVKPRYDD